MTGQVGHAPADAGVAPEPLLTSLAGGREKQIRRGRDVSGRAPGNRA